MSEIDTNTLKQARRDLENATYAALTARPSSTTSQALCTSLLKDLFYRSRRRPSRKQAGALGAVVAELIERGEAEDGGWVYRELRSNSFTGQAVGYRPFIAIFDALHAHQMIDVAKGRSRFAKSEFTNDEWVALRGVATRFRATDWLRGLFEEEGITPETWTDHFEKIRSSRIPTGPAVIRRATGSRNGRGEKVQGQLLPTSDDDAKYTAEVQRIERLNVFLSKQTIEPFGPVALQRIFNEGDHPDFAWDRGGRLYALGYDTYQRAKKEARKATTINGSPTVEFDIRACHLTILAGLGYIPVSALDTDPYHVEGVPRPIVKRWLVAALSLGHRPQRWPAGATTELLAKESIDLKADYPLRAVSEAIVEKYPVFKDCSNNVALGWAELQFWESELMLRIMEKLAYEDGVATLPIHDSLIVSLEAEKLATATMKAVYQKAIGLVPVITVEGEEV